MTNSKISIVIPVFNEENSVTELHNRVKEVFRRLSRPYEMIFIDDGCTDGTFEKLRILQSKNLNLVIIRHYKNLGKSLALMQGFDTAKGDIAITLDGDLQDQPEEIPNFIKKIEEGYDFVNGWRQTRQDSITKRIISQLFNFLTTFLFRIKFQDVNCGMKAFTRKVYKWLDLRGDLHRLIPVLVAHKGYKVSEISVEHKERKFGKSKYRLFRYRGLLDMIALVAGHMTQIRPFHFFCELGLFFLLIAGLSLLGWLVNYESLTMNGRILLGIVGLWSLFLGTIFPIFGFYFQIESNRYHNFEWRKGLTKEIIDFRNQKIE